VKALRDAPAAVQIDAEEDRLREEREALERERQADGLAECPHEPRPQQAELERKHGARHGAHGEEDARALGEPLRQLEVVRIARAPPPQVRQHEQQRQRDARRREHDVKRQRDAHLRARVRQAIHARTLPRPAEWRCPFRA